MQCCYSTSQKEGRRQMAEGRRKEKKKGIQGKIEYTVGLNPQALQDHQPCGMVGLVPPLAPGRNKLRYYLLPLKLLPPSGKIVEYQNWAAYMNNSVELVGGKILDIAL